MQNELISLDDYFRDPQTKIDRRITYKDEYLPKYEDNAKKLLLKINSFLNDLGIEEAIVSSGFRPASVNGKLTNAAKKSYHMICLAVDIKDNPNQDLAKLVASNPDLLRKYDLFMEDMNSTHYWCHLDCGVRSDRPSRIFLP